MYQKPTNKQTKKNQSRVAILLLDTVNFKLKLISRGKEGRYILATQFNRKR